MVSQTAIFRRIVGDHMAPPPLVVEHSTSAGEVVHRMAQAGASAAVVVGEHRRILGIVTEQDVVPRLAGRDQPVQAVMSSPVLTIRADDHLYEAIGYMRRHRRRHLPVVDGQGDLVGMLELAAALEVAAGPLVDDIDRLTHEDSLVGLAEVKAAQVPLAERLLEGGVPAPEIQALLSDINNDIHRRVLRLLVTELAAEGKGTPPVAFACIVMGSGGRGESSAVPGPGPWLHPG